MRVFLLMLFLFMLACQQPVTVRDKAETQAPFQYGPASAYDGRWNSPCVQASTEYVQYHIMLDREYYHQASQFHPDANCLQVVKPPHIIEGRYQLGGYLLSDDGLQVQVFDLHLKQQDKNIVIQDIIYLDGQELFFGIAVSGGDRPSKLDFDNPHSRVNP